MLAIGQGIDFRKFAEYSGIKIEQGRISALDTSDISMSFRPMSYFPPCALTTMLPQEGSICGRERQKRGGRNTPVMDGMVILPRGNFTKTFRT